MDTRRADPRPVGQSTPFPDPLGHVQDLVVVSGTDELIEFASPAARTVLGVEPDRMVGTRTADWIHPHDVEQVRSSRARALEGGEPYTVEIRLRNEQRGWVWCESRIVIPAEADGTSRFVVSSVRDITPRRRAQQLLTLLHRVAVVANEASSEMSLLEGCATAVSDAMGWSVGRVFTVDGDKLLDASHPLHPRPGVRDRADTRSDPVAEEAQWADDAYRSAAVRWKAGEETRRVGPVDGPEGGGSNDGAVAVPIVAQDQVVAVLVWRTAGDDASLRKDLNGALDCLARQVSVAMDRVRSVARIQEAASELARFEIALARLHDMVLFVDPRTLAIVYANQRAGDLAGPVRQALTGRTPWEIWPAFSDSRVRNALATASDGSAPVKFELTLAGPRDTVDVAVLAQRVDDDLVLIGHDVTARNDAAAVRARFASVVEHAAVAVVVVEPSDDISLWNPAAEAMFGYTPDEACGGDWRRLFPINRHGQLQTVIDGVRDGELVRLDTLARRYDGCPFDVSVSFAPVGDAIGRPHPVSLIVADVTEQRQALRLLEASEERFRHLAESAVEGIYQLELQPRMHFRYVNPAMEAITGIPPDAFYANGQILEGWLLQDDAENLRDARRDHDGEGWPVEVRWPRGDGGHSWLSIREQPVETPNDDRRTVQGLVLDVTARHEHEQALQAAVARERAAAEELRRLDDMKAAFLQAVSHELRTPLTSVVGFAQTLRDHDQRLPAARRRQLLERLADNAHKLGSLLADLLDLDRLSRQVIEPQHVVFDLSALCRTVVEDIDRGGHQLHLPSDPVFVTADRALLERIVDNLVRNCLRHTPPGTTVTVAVGRTPEGVELVVQDDGPGIPPDERGRLFDRFQHGPDARTSASPGLGIGLSLVRQFARLHGGDVRLDDTPSGSRFVVTLPATN